MRASIVSLGIVVLSAALLRFWDLREAAIGSRELLVLDPVVQLLQTGSYHPAALTRPALPVYVSAAVGVVHFIFGALTGAWRSAGEVGVGQLLGWSRGFSAILGTLVVLLVYQIGMRWGARHALLAAGLTAVMPTNVLVSREVGDGALLAFFAAATLLVSLQAIERPQRGRFLTAGLCVGFAASSAYPGALLLLVPLTAAWMTRSDEGPRGWRAAAAIVGAVAAFLVVNPRVVTDLPAFLNGVGIAGLPGGFSVMSRVQLGGQLATALQWPGLLLAIAGLALGIVRAVGGPGHTRWTLLVSFPIVYFASLAWHGATSETILIPMLPAMAVLAAIAVVSGVSLLRRFDIPRAARTALIALLTVVVVLPPAVIAIRLVGEARASTAR